MEFKFKANGDIILGKENLIEDENEILLQHIALLFRSFPGDIPGTPYGLSPLSLVEPLSKTVVLEEYGRLINQTMENDPIIQGKIRCAVSFDSIHNTFVVEIYDIDTDELLSKGTYGKENFIENVFEDEKFTRNTLPYFNGIVRSNSDSIILKSKTVKNYRNIRILEPNHVDNITILDKEFIAIDGTIIELYDMIFNEIRTNNYFIDSIESSISAELVQEENGLKFKTTEDGYCILKIGVVILEKDDIPTVNLFDTIHIDNKQAVPHYNYDKLSTEIFIKNMLPNTNYRVKTTRLVIQKE